MIKYQVSLALTKSNYSFLTFYQSKNITNKKGRPAGRPFCCIYYLDYCNY